MKKFVILFAVFLVLAVFGQVVSCKKRNSGLIQFSEFAISASGLLSINGQSTQHLMVPRERYPSQLRGLAVIDIDESVYVARFFQPGGVGVEGFFDVCFQVKNGKVRSRTIENAASIERINSATYAKSNSYLFDSERHLLLKVESSNSIKPTEIVFGEIMKAFSGSSK